MKIIASNNKYNYPQFCAYEKTFVMLKPDAYKRRLDKAILDTIRAEAGLTITDSWEGVAERAKLERNWDSKRNKPFFKDWMDFMSSGKVCGMIVEGDDAVSKVLRIKHAVRKKFAPNQKRENLIHSSDDVNSAKKEINNFFDKIV